MTWQNGIFLPGVALDQWTAPANPGAGANYANQSLASSGCRYQVLALSFLFTTDATVSNRRVQLLFRFDHATLSEIDVFMAQAQVVQPASQAVRYLVSPGYVDSTAIVGLRCLVRLPFPLEMFTPSGAGTGWTMDSDVVNLQAGDALTDMRVYIRMAKGAA